MQIENMSNPAWVHHFAISNTFACKPVPMSNGIKLAIDWELMQESINNLKFWKYAEASANHTTE